MTPRPYVRSVAGWWRHNPFFVRYMAREATSVIVALYALGLLWGLLALADARLAYEQWREAMFSVAAVAFHLVALAVFAYHTWSWFEIMPKTLPILFIGARRVPGGAITAAGLAAALACCAALAGLALWAGP